LESASIASKRASGDVSHPLREARRLELGPGKLAVAVAIVFLHPVGEAMVDTSRQAGRLKAGQREQENAGKACAGFDGHSVHRIPRS
jgi:hypothetical protein